MPRYPDDVTPEEEPPRRDAAWWAGVLERSDSLRAVRPHVEPEARGAVCAYLCYEANVGRGPIGIVSDPRYLLPDAR